MNAFMTANLKYGGCVVDLLFVMPTATTESNRFPCPCDSFISLSKFLAILDSEDALHSLLNWLNGSTDKQALEENRLLSCGKRSRCRFRYGMSFAIINAIRDACHPFLEIGTVSSPSMVQSGLSNQSYDDQFPPLAVLSPKTTTNAHSPGPNVLNQPPKHAQSHSIGTKERPNQLLGRKKSKNRAKLQLVTAHPNTPSTRRQELTDTIPNEQDTSLTAHSFIGTTRVARGGENVPNTSCVHATSSKPVTTLPKTPLQPVERSGDPSEKVHVGDIDYSSIQRIERLVMVYVALFQNLLIPSTTLELHLLIRMLSISETQRGKQQRPYNDANEEAINTFLRPIFINKDSCRQFAIQALSQLQPVLRNLPVQLLRSLTLCAPFRKHCVALTKDLTAIVEEYDRRGLSGEFPPEAVTGTHAILTLPFDQERDSRHTYRTQAEIRLYKNRKRSAIHFYIHFEHL